jgi:transketolase
MSSPKIKEIENMTKYMRRKALDMAYAGGKNGAHLGAGLSSIEILACLYGAAMRFDAKDMSRPDRDYFIPSKAHCVLSFYTALAYVHILDEQKLEEFEQNGKGLPGHPVQNVQNGIDFSGGSLGMGLSQGVGIALASKRKQMQNDVYVLLGDGECQEGSVWEAVMSAGHFGLDNLCIIVDNNKLQYDGKVDDIMTVSPLKEKFQAFGADAYEMKGHDIADILDKLEAFKQNRNGKPKVLIADTVKGKGISFMEGKKEWHHGILSKEQYEAAIRELEERDGI